MTADNGNYETGTTAAVAETGAISKDEILSVSLAAMVA